MHLQKILRQEGYQEENRGLLMPREGIFAKVLTSGWIKPGDDINVIS